MFSVTSKRRSTSASPHSALTERSRAAEIRAAELKDSAVHYAGAARDWAAPRLETAIGTAKDATRTTVDEVVPKVSTAVAAALAASEPVRGEVKTRGTAAIAALKGELGAAPPRRRHRGRRVFVLFAVLAGAAAGWRAWARGQADDQWQDQWSSPSGGTSSWSAPGGTATTTAPAPADPVGASPDELVADAAESPFGVPTTPDDPLDATALHNDFDLPENKA